MSISKLAPICSIGTVIIAVLIAAKLYFLPPASERFFFRTNLIIAKKNLQEIPEMLQGVKKIVCIGDSITRYNDYPSAYPNRLQSYFNAIFPDHELNVISKGIDGQHAKHLLKRFKKDTADAQLVVIFVGVNDVAHGFDQAHPDGSGPRGSSLESYQESIEAMINLAQKADQTLLLVTPLTIFEDENSVEDKKLTEYCDKLKELANQYNVKVCDARLAFQTIAQGYRTTCDASDYILTIDGVHPNDLGNKVITECILSSLGVTKVSRAKVLKEW